MIELQQCPDHEEEWLTSFSRKILGAVYTHCYGHVLNLACGETTKKSKVMRDALDTDCQKSPHCDARLHKIKQEMPEDSPGIGVLCPTRWTSRTDALQSITTNYELLQKLWVESLDFVKETKMKCHIQGVAS